MNQIDWSGAFYHGFAMGAVVLIRMLWPYLAILGSLYGARAICRRWMFRHRF